MSPTHAFNDYMLELLAVVGRVEARRILDGTGNYRVMLPLLTDDVMYVHVDDRLEVELQAQG